MIEQIIEVLIINEVSHPMQALSDRLVILV
jgi:hypothetical protein